MNKQNYLLINFIFAGIILAIFVYSAIYKPANNSHPINCLHEELLGAKCPTCGMSRGFSAIVRGDFSEASNFQQNSLSVFLFFLIQLSMRAVAIYLVLKTSLSLKKITSIDATLSLLVFFVTFRNLIFQTIYIFYKMLLTGNIA